MTDTSGEQQAVAQATTLNFTSTFSVPSPMVCPGDKVANWEFLKQQWEDYEVATGLEKRDAKIRLATLRSVMGKECMQIFMKERKYIEICIGALEAQRNVKTRLVRPASRSVLEHRKPKKHKRQESIFTIEDDLECQLDSGATCNVMSYDDLSRITQIGYPKLHSSTAKLQTCEKFGLIKLNVEPVNVVKESSPLLRREEILSKCKDVFEGSGHMGDASFSVDPESTPVQHAPRRVPVTLHTEVKEKLTELERKGIVVKETDPTDWISRMVVVAKPNKIRICLDPNDLNKALKRPKYQMPTLEEMLPKLSKAKVFTTLDAKDGFYQIALDEASSKQTTFWTAFGRYRYLRMPFGLNTAAKEFECKPHDAEITEVQPRSIVQTGAADVYRRPFIESLGKDTGTPDEDFQNQPMQSREVPDRSWSRVSTDLFTLGNTDYVIVVDSYSDFLEVGKLKGTTSSAIIEFLKEQFSGHGIPDVLVSDNGPQYTSREFTDFTTEWEIKHVTSSPYHAGSNGKSESVVKIAKNLFKKHTRMPKTHEQEPSCQWQPAFCILKSYMKQNRKSRIFEYTWGVRSRK
ncbi:Retrovirus-related Pol poly from transposon, partial, partial [Paramuricea clavata]